MSFSPQSFVDKVGPTVSSAWLNALDLTVNGVLQGATTQAAAQLALGIVGPLALPLTIAEGGTGATSQAGAQAALGLTFLPSGYAQSAQELSLGVVPTNFNFKPCCVDRYVTNATPGTTDTTAAWNTAVAVAQVAGGEVTFGATTLYMTSAPINCTFATTANQFGILIRGIGIASHDTGCGVLARHTGQCVFDCTGNDSITFQDVSIKTDPTTFPSIGILTARNQFKNSLIIRLINVRIQGKFRSACYYNYASEDDVLIGCYFANNCNLASTKCAVWTGSNIQNVTSLVVGGIATGTISCIDHNIIGCQFWNSAGNSVQNADCIYIEASDSVKIFGGWACSAGGPTAPATGVATASAVAGVMTVSGTWTGTISVGQQVNGSGVPPDTVVVANGSGSGGNGTYTISSARTVTWASTAIDVGTPGRALIYVDQSVQPSNFCTVIGLTGEQCAPIQKYGILFSDPGTTVTPSNWKIDSCKLTNGGNAVASAGPNVNPVAFNMTNVSGGPYGYGISFTGTVQDSRLDTGYTMVIGTSLRNHLIGDTSLWTVTTRSHDSWYETGIANRSFAPGVANGMNGWVVTGALTQRGKLSYVGNEARFTIILGAATNIGCTAGAIIGMPFTTTDTASVAVCDTTGAALGYGVLAGGLITFPTAIATNTNSLVIQGFGFVS